MLPHATYARLCRARDLIRDCLAEPVSLADAAEEADLSAWHFQRLFCQAFGESPHAFRTRLRLDRARELLTVTSRSVTDICLDIGFSSLGSFSTLFARHVGASPEAYRRQVRILVVSPGFHPWAAVPACFVFHFAGNRKIREASHPTPRVHLPPVRPTSYLPLLEAET